MGDGSLARNLRGATRDFRKRHEGRVGVREWGLTCRGRDTELGVPGFKGTLLSLSPPFASSAIMGVHLAVARIRLNPRTLQITHITPNPQPAITVSHPRNPNHMHSPNTVSGLHTRSRQVRTSTPARWAAVPASPAAAAVRPVRLGVQPRMKSTDQGWGQRAFGRQGRMWRRWGTGRGLGRASAPRDRGGGGWGNRSVGSPASLHASLAAGTEGCPDC